MNDQILDPGDTIFVGGGTYLPGPRILSSRKTWFELRPNVKVRGGYWGWFVNQQGQKVLAGNPGSRNIELHESILSGDIDYLGVEANDAYHVVFAPDLDSSDLEPATLDGFTITSGSAAVDDDDLGAPLGVPVGHTHNGGGLYAYNSNLNVIRCTFKGNKATGTGGSFGLGGGAYVGGTRNSGDDQGVEFIDCLFFENEAARGGAVAVEGEEQVAPPPPEVTKAIFTNCVMAQNDAKIVLDPSPNEEGTGAGVFLWWQVQVTMTNCTIADNDSEHNAGGLRYEGVEVPNQTPTSSTRSEVILRNCNVWGNTGIAQSNVKQIFREGDVSNGPTVDASTDYCNIEGGVPLNDVIVENEILDLSPVFVSPQASITT